MKNNTVKIGNVELTDNEALKLYKEHRYIVTYKSVYQLFYSQNVGGVYGNKIYYHYNTLPLTKRGRFYAMTAREVNKLIGHEILIED